MKVKNLTNWVFGLLIVTLTATVSAQEDETDPVLSYYWRKTAGRLSALHQQMLLEQYVLTIQTFFQTVSKRGEVTATDTVTGDYYFTGTQLDSVVADSSTRTLTAKDFVVPELFDIEYDLNFYPNDTGGQELSIGFDTDSTDVTNPVGLLIVDRGQYLPIWLFAHFPGPESGEVESRCFRFAVHEGMLYPDSLWVVGSKTGIFQRQRYRVESGVTNVKRLLQP